VSAVDVYSECQQSGGGGKPTTNSSSGGSVTPYVSPQTAKALKKAGSDGQALSNLVRGYSGARLLQLHAGSGEPDTVASAFDLGSGPTVLLIALVGAAVLLLGATGVRSVRQRRH
jgi:hypothetical protein